MPRLTRRRVVIALAVFMLIVAGVLTWATKNTLSAAQVRQMVKVGMPRNELVTALGAYEEFHGYNDCRALWVFYDAFFIVGFDDNDNVKSVNEFEQSPLDYLRFMARRHLRW